jgi:predicted kinase
MKLLLLNGSSCSGKSTIIRNIMKQKDHLFCLSYDKVKWSFANYNSAEHYQAVHKILLATANVVFKEGYDVICSALYASARQEFIDLAQAAGYEIMEINLAASFEVLCQRFAERVESAAKSPNSTISNTSLDRFKELFDIFNQEKNPDALTFNTETQSAEEITAAILKLF